MTEPLKRLYVTISSKEAEFRLHRAMEVQRQFPEALAGWDKLLVTDTDAPATAPEGFSVLKLPLFRGEKLHFPTYRNMTMQYAADHGYDWLIQSTADIVMLTGPTSYPPNSFTSVMTYLTQKDEAIDDVLSRWRAGTPLHFGASTYYLMGRPIFSKYRVHDGYLGYGHEDGDFMSNVLYPAGIERLDGTPFGARAIHIFEPKDQWVGIGEDLEKNKALFQDRLRRTRRGERV